ncbi:uncharacterized protein LOC134768956 [Penaeus indicus]|uniref:uncharacterized protein LOC134768956 n=1 Tax=Penaeus indicus TaxID=29960 RepID=UPI00300D5515
MLEIGFSKQLVELIRNLYGHQLAKVRTTHGFTDWFEIGQGMRQGCILSLHLFNIYSEGIMRRALDGFNGSIKIGGRTITNLRYADDVVLVAGSMLELQTLVNRINESSLQAGLQLNASKTKVLKIINNHGDNKDNIKVNGNNIENLDNFIYLGAMFTNNYNGSNEIKRRLTLARNAMISLTSILKDKAIWTQMLCGNPLGAIKLEAAQDSIGVCPSARQNFISLETLEAIEACHKMTAVRSVDGQIILDHVGVRECWADYFEQIYQVDPPTASLDASGIAIPVPDLPISEEPHTLIEGFGSQHSGYD